MRWGEALMRATIAGSVVAYACAEYVWFAHRQRAFRARAVLWTAAFGLCVLHTALAFHVRHDWSQAAAWRHTAEMTAALTGLHWGGGLYVNYLFLAVWAADVTWLWAAPASYLARAARVNAVLSTGFLFIVFNGAVVFATGPARAIGLAATLVVIAGWLRARGRRDTIVAA
jgi:hypothetical protein